MEKVILAHAISAQDPQTFYNLKAKFKKEWGMFVKTEVITVTPVMVGAQGSGVGRATAQLIIVPAAYYEIELTEEKAREFRVQQSLMVG